MKDDESICPTVFSRNALLKCSECAYSTNQCIILIFSSRGINVLFMLIRKISETIRKNAFLWIRSIYIETNHDM